MLAGFVSVPQAKAAVAALSIVEPDDQRSGVNVPALLLVKAAGGTAPYSWTAQGLPSGVAIDTQTGIITGTPLREGRYAATVTVADADDQRASTAFGWITGQAPTVANPGDRASLVGETVKASMTGRGATAPYAWSATGLPAGISIDAASGAIAGAPTTAGVYTAQITATDTAQMPGTATFVWDVATTNPDVAVPATQHATIGEPSSLTLSATGGTSPYIWTADRLPAGMSLDPDTGVISGTPTTAGSHTITVTATDTAERSAAATFGWATAKAPVIAGAAARAGVVDRPVSERLTATDGTAPYTWSASGLPQGLTLDASTGVISGTPTTAGTSSVTITATDAQNRAGTKTVAWSVSVPLAANTAANRQTTAGKAASQLMSAVGGITPYTWSASGLPQGLTIDTATGVISGTPTTAGSSPVTVTVTDHAGGTARTTFTWTTRAALTADRLADQHGTVGTHGDVVLKAAGGSGPYTWSVTGLPAGLTLDPATGTIAGGPSLAGDYTVTATVTDAAADTATVTYRHIIDGPVAVTTIPRLTGTVGKALTVTVHATGGAGTYTWAASALPAGLVLDATTGVVTGAPSTAGTFTVTVTATDQHQRSNSQSFDWVISETDGRAVSARSVVFDPTSGPVMDVGSVATITAPGALTGPGAITRGVAVIGSYAYLNRGTELVKVDKSTGAVTTVAGVPNSPDCINGTTGAEVRFTGNVRVLGTDGRFVYVMEACAVRRVDPSTGASISLVDQPWGWNPWIDGTVGGKYLYLINNSGGVMRYDLTGATPTAGLPGRVNDRGTALAADANHLYAIASDNKVYRIDDWDNGTRTPIATLGPIDTNWTMASVGDYLYASWSDYNASPNRAMTVVRISKTDGGTLLISPSGTGNTALTGVTGIASDGTKLYVADRDDNGTWLRTLTSVTAKPVAGGATAPVMDAASVSTVTAAGALTGPGAITRGVAVIGSYAYLNRGTELVRVGKTSGDVTVIAGAVNTNDCYNGATGDQVRFAGNVRVIGADGRFVYVLDNCGLRRVDPANGATSTVTAQPANWSNAWVNGTIGGTFAYLINNYGGVCRYDLTGSTPATGLSGNVNDRSTALAADDNYLYAIDNQQRLHRIDWATSTRTMITTLGPLDANVTMLSVGDYLYASWSDYNASPNRAFTVVRISKTDGSTLLISPSGTGNTALTGVTGITSDGTKLYIADRDDNGTWLRTLTSVTAKPVAGAATSPTMDTASVSTVTAAGALTGPGAITRGVAVIGSYAYLNRGTELVRVGKTSGDVTVIAGAVNTNDCYNGATGDQVRFAGNVRVIGADGRFVYVLDNCGLRRVDPANGATSTVTAQPANWANAWIHGTIGGRYAYLINNYGGVNRFALTGSTPATGISGKVTEYSFALAADDTYLYAIASDNKLYRIDWEADTRTPIAILGTRAISAAMLSVGDYLYVAIRGDTNATSVSRIGKTTGFAETIAGNIISGAADGLYTDARFTSITGLATDGTYLYVADDTWLRQLKKAKRPVDPGGPSLPWENAGGQNPSNSVPCSAACHGDPVQTDTGALLEPETDLTVYDRGTAFDMSRTYSSEKAGTNSVLGYGWAWQFGMNITQPSTDTVIVTQENGSAATFSRQADGTYKGAPRLQATLVKNTDGTWTFVRKNQITMTFNAAGKIVRQESRSGRTVTFTYNGGGQLTAVTLNASRTLTFTYDTAGYLQTVTAPSGAQATYTQDSDGNLTEVTDPEGATTYYDYSIDHLLTGMINKRGAAAVNTYDAAGRVIKQVEPRGTWEFTYADGDQVGTSTVTITKPGGATTVEQYVDGQLRSQTNAAGTADAATTTWAYDPTTSQPVTVTAPDGTATRYTYDTAGRKLTQTDPLNRTTSWTYNTAGDVLSVLTPGGRLTEMSYDARGNMLTSTTAGIKTVDNTYNPDSTLDTAIARGGATTTYAYTTTGDQRSVTDPMQRVTSYTYDQDGRPTTVTDNTQQKISETAYNRNGLKISASDGLGNTTTYGYYSDGTPHWATDPETQLRGYSHYDLAGRLTKTVDTVGKETTYEYTAAGQPKKVTDANGSWITYTYDGLGQKKTATTTAGTTMFTYDRAGRLLTTRTPTGAVTTTEYNAAGEIVKTIDAKLNATTYTYDADGRPKTTTDPNGRVTSTAYTALGQTDTITHPDNSTTAYRYFDNGVLQTVTNPDHGVTSYTYNTAGQQLTRTLPGNLTTAYQYDQVGRLHKTIQNDGSTVTRAYDKASRVTDLTYSDTSTAPVHYQYDRAGRRTAMTDGTGTTTYTYDATGRLTGTRTGTGDTVGYGYDDGGRLTTLTYPNSRTVTYTYDTANRMTSATDWNNQTTEFTWTADGQRDLLKTPNGVTSNNDYDANGQLTTVNLTRGTTNTGQYGYTYDQVGQLTTSTSPTGTQNYTFDPLGQVASVDTAAGDGATGDYAITPNGLLKELPNGTQNTYNNTQQVVSTTTAAGEAVRHTYDIRGNRTITTATDTSTSHNVALPTATYTYDKANNLTAVTTAATTVDYTYNGDGLRVSRSNTAMVWATHSTMPLLLDDGTHSYLYGPNLTPYAQISDNGTTEYLHTDALGSVRTITDTTGTTVATHTYDTYGTRTHHTGNTDSAIGYTGNWTDPDTGIVHFRARDYDPVTGQFLTIDPKVDSTLQPYAYAENNPLQLTDPAGLCADCHWLEKLVLSGPEEETLSSGFGGVVVDFFIGIGDGASFGLTGLIRDTASPGSGCLVQSQSWAYMAGDLASIFLPGPGGKATAPAKVTRAAKKVGSKIRSFFSKCEHSFAPNTRVLMANGRAKRIREIEVGDEVIATEPRSGNTSTRTVTATHTNRDLYLTNITVRPLGQNAGNEGRNTSSSTDQLLRTTSNHPFWDKASRNWVLAGSLTPGDSELLAPDGSTQLVVAVQSFIGEEEMRDLTVADIHTYYVIAGSSPVLVHNCNLKPGNNPAAKRGTSVHNGPEWAEHLASLGYTPGREITPGNIPDGLTPDGFPVELKPHTASGIKAGTRQLRRYMREMGVDSGELWTYRDTPDGLVFELVRTPNAGSRRWTKW